MKRSLRVALLLYLIAAAIGHVLEATGVTRCGCSPDCWCKKRGLSSLRWVLPFWHRQPSGGIDPGQQPFAVIMQ